MDFRPVWLSCLSCLVNQLWFFLLLTCQVSTHHLSVGFDGVLPLGGVVFRFKVQLTLLLVEVFQDKRSLVGSLKAFTAPD